MLDLLERLEYKMLHNRVRVILRDKPKTRNSDQELVLEVWEQFGLYLSNSQKAKFLEIPTSDTITRVRRKIQEGGEYQATENIKKFRKIKSMIVQQNIPKTKEVDKLFDDTDFAVKKYWI